MSGGGDYNAAAESIIGFHSTVVLLMHLNVKIVQGGESVALARLADQLSDKKWVADFEKVCIVSCGPSPAGIAHKWTVHGDNHIRGRENCTTSLMWFKG